MGQIILTVKAIDWAEGDVGHVGVYLNGGSCRIDWGDGYTQSLQTHKRNKQPEGLYVLHSYPQRSKVAGERFNIIITSTEDNIVGIRADSGEMDVDDIDIRSCQSLKYFQASYLIRHFDLTGNPGIKKIDLQGEACSIADFSNSTELRELYFGHTGGGRYDDPKILDLTKCNKLEYLECQLAFRLTHIVISNQSALKEFVYDEHTPLSEKSLAVIKRILDRNGGKITKYSDQTDE